MCTSNSLDALGSLLALDPSAYDGAGCFPDTEQANVYTVSVSYYT